MVKSLFEACPRDTCTCLDCTLFREQDNVLSRCASSFLVNSGNWVFRDTLYSVIPQVISVVIRTGITSVCNSSVCDGCTGKARRGQRRTRTQACQYLRYNMYINSANVLIVKLSDQAMKWCSMYVYGHHKALKFRGNCP